MKKILLGVFLLVQVAGTASAQCAMCRSTLENNFSNGQPGIAAGMNIGILYLLFLPYVAAMVIGYLWYKSSRNAGKEFSRRNA
ncbi:MAG TPA: hypothetical protein VF490_13315 [Chryseosolibacter sp.]